MAKNHQIEGSNSRIYGSSGGLFEEGGGGLSTICCSRVGAYSRGAIFEGGHSWIYGILYLT